MNLDRLLKHYILDADHHLVEVDLLTWARWFEVASNRIVEWTQVTSEITVSTVFLGLDHRYTGKGPPVCFETMVFAPDHIQLKGGDLFWTNWMRRYSSWDDAIAGHAAAVRKVREHIGHKASP